MADEKIPEELVDEPLDMINYRFGRIATKAERDAFAEHVNRILYSAGATFEDRCGFFSLFCIIDGILGRIRDYERCDIPWIPIELYKEVMGKEVLCRTEVALENFREVVADIKKVERLAAVFPDQELSKKLLVVSCSVCDQLGHADVNAESALEESESEETIGYIRDAFKSTYFTLGSSLAPLVGEVKVFLDNVEDKAAKAVMAEDEPKKEAEVSNNKNKTPPVGSKAKKLKESLEIRVARVIIKYPDPRLSSNEVAKLAEVGGKSPDGIVRGTKSWKNRKQIRKHGKIINGRVVVNNVSSGFSDTGKRNDVVPVFNEPQAEHIDINDMIKEFDSGKRKKYPTPEDISERLNTPDDPVSIERAKELLKETKNFFGYDD